MNFTSRTAKSLTIGALAIGGAVASACSGAAPIRGEETPASSPLSRIGDPVAVAIVPRPMTVRAGVGTFLLSPSTPIRFTAGDPDVAWVATYLSQLLPVAAGEARAPTEIENGTISRGAISLLLDASLDTLGDEGYLLSVTPEGITASARRAAGLFYAVQSFRQLLPPQIELRTPLGAQAVSEALVADRPRFQWRGAMLDVSRHFLNPADVKRFINLMALYKLNRLHLHLADDQGWRIEIKSWPNLSAHGGSTAVGGGPGGFYTQAEYADIVEYARRRFITVIPEIDMPGHTNAALASYAELNCDGRARPLYTGIRVGFSALCPSREVTYRFVDDVVREISALTPGPWFHIGGDEVKTLSAAQYAAFIERVQTIVQSHGKRMIGWDEIAAAKLLPTTVVQYWRPNASAAPAARQRAKFIMSPAHKVYLDMKYDSSTTLGQKWAAYIEVRTAYGWDPATLLADVRETDILGVEAPLWSETMVTIADVEYMAFPRLAAVAEVGWTPQGGRNWEDFRIRLAAQAPRWSALGVNFHRSPQIPWH